MGGHGKIHFKNIVDAFYKLILNEGEVHRSAKRTLGIRHVTSPVAG